MDLPTHITLTPCGSATEELGTIETLFRETAKLKIDAVWWENLTGTLRNPEDEPDYHWEWHVIISKTQNKPYFRAKCIRSQSGQIQAAMLFRVDAMSALEDGEKAVFIDRLATAPKNRDKLVKKPVFRGGGSGLLKYAITVSYSLGFSGRVNLFPVANEGFYTRIGFQPTGETEGEDTLFELEASVALNMLKKWGLIDG